jgi:uncharacterized protein
VTDFLDAVRAGDRDAVRTQLQENPSRAGARDEHDTSAVRLALYHGQAEVADELLAAGPELDVWDAAALGDVDRLRALLDDKPYLAAAYAPDGFYPLGLAAFFSRPDAVALLLERGAQPDQAAATVSQVRAVHAAAAARDHESMRLVLEAGAAVDARQHGGLTPLHAAAQHGDQEMVELLVAHGADPKLSDNGGRDAAAHAEAGGFPALAEWLRERG